MTTIERHADVFRMPALGADMTEGRVIEWYVAEGARAERGDLVAVVETDKSDIEIEVFDPCVFDEFLVELGEPIAVGEPIARVTVDGPAGRSGVPETDSRTVDPTGEPMTDIDAPVSGRRHPDRSAPRPRLTPRARHLARIRGLDLADHSFDGIVTGDTVLQLSPDDAAPAPRDRSAGMRSAVARLMQRSWTDIPHYHVTSTVDITDAGGRLDHVNAGSAVTDRIVPAAMLYAAVARAARDTPQLNGWWHDGSFEGSESVDLGVVLSLRGGGIVVPTIPSADGYDTSEMMIALRDLVERARRGRLRERDLRPASISITNMGDRGAESVLGIIHPPQVALVGLGAPGLRPAVVDGVVVPRLVVEASVAGDHRAHDGLIASRLLERLTDHLEDLP